MRHHHPTLENEFNCLMCGKCCRWKGAVKITAEEVDGIAQFMNMNVDDFIDKHTYLLPDRSGLSLNENSDGSCSFLDSERNICTINAVKPSQCKRFPYTWRFPGWDEICEGGKLLTGSSK